MFELVPVLMLQREIISRRHMPAQKDEVHRQPRHDRRSQKMAKTPQPFQPKQRPDQANSEPTREAAQQRNHGISQQQERRNERHQQQMLHHVRTQQRIGEPIERRSDSDPDCR